MARKTLLNESEIRRFMKLASIEPLAENGFGSFAPNPHLGEEAVEDEDEDELEDSDMEMGAPEDAVDAPMDEPAIDDMEPDLGDVEPTTDLERTNLWISFAN